MERSSLSVTANMVAIDLGVLVLFTLIAGILYKWVTKNNDYFHEKPIPSMAAKPLFGSTGPLVLKKYSLHGFITYVCNKFPNVK